MPITHAGLSEEGIITEVINGADLRFFLTDPRELFAVDITLLRFAHGHSTFCQFCMGAFRPVFWICINAGIMGAVMPILRRLYFRIIPSRFCDGRWAVDPAAGSARHNARNKAGSGIIARSFEDARRFRGCVFAVRGQKFMHSETIPVF